MNPTALILMLITMALVAVATGFFFWKVLKTPSKPETEDAY